MRGILTRTAHTHGMRENLCIFTVTPDPLRGIRMKSIKRMKLKKGATFLPERYYLSRSLQPPFSGNKHQYVIPSSGYLLSHRLHRFSFVLRTPNLTTTYTTYTTSNGDIVAKGQVVLVVHVGVNSKFVVVNSDLLSLTISVPIRVYPMPHKICEICAICVKKKKKSTIRYFMLNVLE